MNKDERKSMLAEILSMFDLPTSVKELAKAVGIRERHATCPITRKLIRELIEEGVPIGSDNTGYFMIKSERDLQVYLNGLLKRQMKISARILAVYNAYHGK